MMIFFKLSIVFKIVIMILRDEEVTKSRLPNFYHIRLTKNYIMHIKTLEMKFLTIFDI